MNDGIKMDPAEKAQEVTPVLSITVNPEFWDINPHFEKNEDVMKTTMWLWILFAVAICLFVTLCIAVWHFLPISLFEMTNMLSVGVSHASLEFNTWPFALLLLSIISATVILCWIDCNYAIKTKRIAAEERKQQLETKRFLVEKSFEIAQLRRNKASESKYSITISVDKGGNRGTKDNSDDEGNPSSKSPTKQPTPSTTPVKTSSLQLNQGNDGGVCSTILNAQLSSVIFP